MDQPEKQQDEAKLIEGRDFYLEGGLFVLTEHFLRKRGYCCENGCRHCPYGFTRENKIEPSTTANS